MTVSQVFGNKSLIIVWFPSVNLLFFCMTVTAHLWRQRYASKSAKSDELNVEVIDVDKAEDVTSILNIFKQFWEVVGCGVKNVK